MKGTLRGTSTGLQGVFKGRFKGNFEGDFEGNFGGDLEVDLEGDSKGGLQRGLQRGLQTGHGRGLAVKLRLGKVQVWFSLQRKFNSFELDSEVGRLVISSNPALQIYFWKRFLISTGAWTPVFPVTLFCVLGLPDPGLPNGPGPVSSGHPDMSPHHRQLRLGCQ